MHSEEERLLFQLTRLMQLTKLEYVGPFSTTGLGPANGVYPYPLLRSFAVEDMHMSIPKIITLSQEVSGALSAVAFRPLRGLGDVLMRDKLTAFDWLSSQKLLVLHEASHFKCRAGLCVRPEGD